MLTSLRGEGTPPTGRSAPRSFLFGTALLFSVFSLHAETAAPSHETQIVYLSGHGSDDAVEWDFTCNDGRKSGVASKIRVPSCWEQEGFGTYNYGLGFYGKANPVGIAREQGKYHREFQVPAEWQSGRVQIVFEGVMTDAKVRVNGISAGSTHQGGFYRFRYDITGLLKFGAKNQLEVTVDKESANESVNLAERRADYWNFGGIFRPVFLEVLPARFIERTAINAQADGSFSAEVFLGDGVNGSATKVTAQIIDSTGADVGAPFEAAPAPGGDKLVLHAKISAPKRWTAETPNLYRARFTLSQDGVAQHIVSARFGFRTFEVRAGDGLYLNGQRILLKGVNRHSFWPETGRTLNHERNFSDVRLIREMNMNAVRMSHYPPDPDFLEACDELGLYVLDELGGWHGAYDSGIGHKLVGEMVRRDVNHPSILFWDNGNEGGWNTELDGDFAQWDPSQRPVLHPQKKLSGVETMHYRSYGETQEYLRGPDIFMPTEFLHGLYDGGLGAGLWDYWEMMRQHPRAGGGFLWVFADEGVVRTDQDGRVDNVGSYAPDGIVGPHHEREGSFNTIREVWSPVQVVSPSENAPLPDKFESVTLENRYDFTDLHQCTFEWKLLRFPSVTEWRSAPKIVQTGELAGWPLAPHQSGELGLRLPANWKDADEFQLTVHGPSHEVLWTWSWHTRAEISPQHSAAIAQSNASKSNASSIKTVDDVSALVVTTGDLSLRFDKTTGRLASVSKGAQPFSLGNGPRFIAARRGNRTLDGSIDADAPKGVDRIYNEIIGAEKISGFSWHTEGSDLLVEVTFLGALRSTHWRISPDGTVRLDYEYSYDGVVELMGVKFDYPETSMRSIRWLGHGPYRVWQNRLHGTTPDVWENTYNDSIPGETFLYPEFKGYFRGWRWSAFTTTEGIITMENGTPGSFLGVYTPRDGRDAMLYTLPATGLAVLDVIPAVRNKVNATDLIGPSSQAQHESGVHRGAVTFRFESSVK